MAFEIKSKEKRGGEREREREKKKEEGKNVSPRKTPISMRIVMNYNFPRTDWRTARDGY